MGIFCLVPFDILLIWQRCLISGNFYSNRLVLVALFELKLIYFVHVFKTDKLQFKFAIAKITNLGDFYVPFFKLSVYFQM